MKKLSLLLSLVFCFDQVLIKNAHSFDVKGDYLTIVVEADGDFRSFSLCKAGAPECDQLGTRKWYSLDDLEEIKRSEKRGFYKTAAASAGMVVVGAVAGGMLGYFVGLPFSLYAGSMAGMDTAMSIGMFAGVTSPLWSPIIHPVRQYKEMVALSDELITDENIVESDKKIKKLAEILDKILD